MHLSDLRHDNPNLQQKLEYLYGLRTGSKVNWDGAAYRALLSGLGNPHLKIPPVIHVAGTNGKGSVVAMLRAMLEASGRRVHVYTSPHLIRVNERIVIAGEEISDTSLEAAIDDVLARAEDMKLTFFEVLTAVAFHAFAHTPADITLLEVGMGGALDCTNVIENPLACAINRISMDHTEFLGRTIEEISVQKAGIMKRNVPCVAGYQGEGGNAELICNVLEKEAGNRGALLLMCGKDWHVSKTAAGFVYRGADGAANQYPLPNLLGAHQIYNAGVALTVLDVLKDKIPVSKSQKAQGLQNIRWRGRLQRLADAPDGSEIWLDGGHNDSAGEVLAQQAAEWYIDNPLPLYLIVGMLGGKDINAFLQPLLPLCSGIQVARIESEPNCHTLEHVLSCTENLYDPHRIDECSCVSEGIDRYMRNIPEKKRILIAGSVYLAGEALRTLPDTQVKS